MESTLIARFESKFEKPNNPDECWIWQGASNKVGYGQLHHFINKNGNKQPIYAHRVSFSYYTDKKIPKGFDIHHTCENRLCVNPRHLELKSRKDHTRISTNHHATKTHCKHGHEFTPENTYLRKRNGEIHRNCKKCSDIRNRKRYEK